MHPIQSQGRKGKTVEKKVYEDFFRKELVTGVLVLRQFRSTKSLRYIVKIWGRGQGLFTFPSFFSGPKKSILKFCSEHFYFKSTSWFLSLVPRRNNLLLGIPICSNGS